MISIEFRTLWEGSAIYVSYSVSSDGTDMHFTGHSHLSLCNEVHSHI